MNSILRNVSWRCLRVWQRNASVYLKTWQVNFMTPLLEPLLFLFAFGFGLGQLLKTVSYNGVEIKYLTFIAPGILSTVIMNYAFFETTYASFVRMYYQKTYDAILATPLLVEDVITGEILWGATKAMIASLLMVIIVSFFGLLQYPSALWIIPVSFISGLLFASIGMVFTGLVRMIEQFNFPFFLFITPMFLFSGVFFPLTALPTWTQKLALLLPLTHLVIVIRQLAMNRLDSFFFVSLGVLLALTAASFILALVIMKKRLVK
ncbi:MAG: ABC transporter permease [Candidatus Omnitrophota bacterium]